MRSANLLMLVPLTLLTCCHKQVGADASGRLQADPGWHHRWSEYRNYVRYGFTDEAHTVFAGFCNTDPVFGLFNGDYSFRAQSFTLTIDDRTWTLPAFQGNHGRFLLVEGKELVEALRTAKRLIRFRVDDGWTRQFAPAPDLSQMIEQCWSLRRVDPDAMGRLAHLNDHS